MLTHSTPEYPVLNVPPIVYTMKPTTSNASALRKETEAFSIRDSLSDANAYMTMTADLSSKGRETAISQLPVSEKVAFMPMNATEYAAVPYDPSVHKDVSDLAGSVGSRFRAPKTTKAAATTKSATPESSEKPDQNNNKMDDYIFHFYVGSLSLVGLLMLFRIIQKS